MSSLPCIFPELLTAVDCHLVLRSDETVFGAGRDLRLHPFPSGPWPVIPLHLLQQGLPSGVQLSVGTPDSPTDAAIYYIGDCRIGSDKIPLAVFAHGPENRFLAPPPSSWFERQS